MTLTQDWLTAIDGTNALAATIEFSRYGLIQHADPGDAARVMFEDADPVRDFPSWSGKRNFEGKLWMASTRRHVPFESFWERSFLTSLDRTGEGVNTPLRTLPIRLALIEGETVEGFTKRLAQAHQCEERDIRRIVLDRLGRNWWPAADQRAIGSPNLVRRAWNVPVGWPPRRSPAAVRSASPTTIGRTARCTRT